MTPRLRALLALTALLTTTSCFSAWDVGGPWACTNGTCAEGYVCDDGVCCRPGSTPACPTLPSSGACPGGAAATSFVRDVDGDGVGDEATRRDFCRAPVQERWVTTSGDCDDGDVGISPNAPERCNAIDDDCDGTVDDGLRLQTWRLDTDGDGFGDDCATCARQACAAPPGYASSGGDCATTDATVFPGAPERCNGRDDNCNGQLDDPPFVDVENPGQDGGSFPCDTGRPGVCQAGGLQCVFSADAGFRQTCVPRQLPSPDVCGNGLDDDCSGSADDRPGCGGPADLLNAPGVSSAAIALTPPGGIGVLPTSCLKNTAGAQGMGWLSPSWIGTDPFLHVWWAEAPPGETWDVSTASTLHLAARHIFISPNSVPGEGAWGNGGRFPNAVVALCGDQGDTVRYVPSGTERITGSGNPMIIDVPLRGGALWTVSGNTATTLPRVRRVEVWMSPQPPEDGGLVTFTNRFLSDAGLNGFR